MKILTVDVIPGHRYRYCQALIQIETVGIASWRDAVVRFTDFWGGRAKMYDSPIVNATQSMVNRLAHSATALGADVIIGFDIQIHQVTARYWGWGMAQIVMRGTPIQFTDRQSMGTMFAGETTVLPESADGGHSLDGHREMDAMGMDDIAVPSLDSARLGTRL
ncbi:MAG: heavy metal-binding domain-containing protein [Nitrospira sp.]|nr:heavy metal-binding domain-containing protein [Nitrospira sp.]